MLKKYQVLLDDWQEEYIKSITERYDLSSSGVIRTHICIAILNIIPLLYPEYKPKLSSKEFQDLFKKASKNELKEEDIHKMISKILFECRKAIEFRSSKLEKLKK